MSHLSVTVNVNLADAADFPTSSFRPSAQRGSRNPVFQGQGYWIPGSPLARAPGNDEPWYDTVTPHATMDEALVIGESSHAPDERRRADRRVPDPAEDALRVRPMRARQRRASRRALRRARPHRVRLAAPRAGRRPYGGRLFPRAPRAGRDAPIVRAGVVQHRDAARGGVERFLRPDGDYGQCADLSVQPQPIPGDKPPPPGGLPEHHPTGGQAQLPTHARRHASARAAPSGEPYGVGPARPPKDRKST